MKKIGLTILIIVLASLLSGCQKRTDLTLENCKDYLSFTAYFDCDNDKQRASIKDQKGNFYKEATLLCKMSGASQNFNYYDIDVTVKVIIDGVFYIFNDGDLVYTFEDRAFTYKNGEKAEESFSELMKLHGNVSGRSETQLKDYDFGNRYIDAKNSKIEVEIIDVKGYVMSAEKND